MRSSTGAMVAAATADGQVDADERARLLKGMAEAGIDPDATRWLQEELASPADAEELAAPVNTPEKAAQVYAAARIAIDPDTMQEREFLRQLAKPSISMTPSARGSRRRSRVCGNLGPHPAHSGAVRPRGRMVCS